MCLSLECQESDTRGRLIATAGHGLEAGSYWVLRQFRVATADQSGAGMAELRPIRAAPGVTEAGPGCARVQLGWGGHQALGASERGARTLTIRHGGIN